MISAILCWMHLFKHFCMKTYLWTLMHQIVRTLYFVVSDFTHFTIWCIKVQINVFVQKCLCILYINKCIQNRMADIKNISWLWILILQQKQVNIYCFRSFSTVAIHPPDNHTHTWYMYVLYVKENNNFQSPNTKMYL